MTNAPENIWAGKYHHTWWQSHPHHQMTQYTRTDLHLALVAAAYEAADILGYHCVGCGHLCGDPEKDLKIIRKAGSLSCCPERKMEPLSAAIRAITPSDAKTALKRMRREAHREALQQAILAVSGCDRVSDVQPALRKLMEENDDE